MRKKTCKRCQVVVVWGLCVGGLFLGCGDSGPRKAGNRILEKVREAQRLYAQALSLMQAPPYKIGGEFAPPTRLEAINPDDIQAVVSEPINPKVLEVLSRAEGELDRALKENPAAEASDKALGYMMLGRISALEGQYHAGTAGAVRGKAVADLIGVEGIIASVQSRRRLITYFDQLAGMTDDDIKKQLSSTKTDVSKFTTQIEALSGKISTLREKSRTLGKVNRKLLAEGRNFKIESRSATGRKSLELFDKFQQKQREANRVEHEIAEAEDRIATLEGDLKLLELGASAAKGRLNAAESILESRSKRRTADLQKRKDLLGSLVQARADVGKLLGTAADATENLEMLEGDAVNAYQRAANRFAKARQMQPPPKPPEMLVQQAGTVIYEGQLYVHKLDLQGQIQRVCKELPKLWHDAQPATQPSSVQRLTGYAGNPDDIRTNAQQKFEQAVKLYEQAKRLAKPKEHMWLYEEGLAFARSALRRVSQTP